MARITGNDFYLTADFNDRMRVDLIDKARKDLSEILGKIHTYYKKGAKKAFITGEGLPKGIDPLSKEKKKQYEDYNRKLLLWEGGQQKMNTTEMLKGFINY